MKKGLVNDEDLRKATVASKNIQKHPKTRAQLRLFEDSLRTKGKLFDKLFDKLFAVPTAPVTPPSSVPERFHGPSQAETVWASKNAKHW